MGREAEAGGAMTQFIRVSNLAVLLERVKAATGPNQELDAQIGLAFGWEPNIYHTAWFPPDYDDDLKDDYLPQLPLFTASIDAALALVEKVLPGWKHAVGNHCPGNYCWLWPDSKTNGHFEKAASESAAILAAMLSALIEKEKTHEEATAEA